MTEITSLACGGSRSPSSFLWLRSPCSSRGTKRLLGLEARQASGADRNWCKWPPSGLGRGALCRPCGLGKPGQPSAANLVGGRAQATPAARCSWASSWLKGISFRRWSHLASSPPPSCPASLSAPKSRVLGLCQQGAMLPCPSGMGLCGLERTSGLPQPPQPGHLWPRGTQWQGQPEPGKGHASLCARQVAEHPRQDLPGTALATEAS